MTCSVHRPPVFVSLVLCPQAPPPQRLGGAIELRLLSLTRLPPAGRCAVLLWIATPASRSHPDAYGLKTLGCTKLNSASARLELDQMFSLGSAG